MPTNVAARMTLAAAPDALRGWLRRGPRRGLDRARDVRCVRGAARTDAVGGRDGSRPPLSRTPRPEYTQRAPRCRGSAIRCTSRSIPESRGSSSSQTRAASAARTSRSRERSAKPSPTPGEAAHAQRLHGNHGGHARPRFPSASVRAVPILARTASLLRTSRRRRSIRSASHGVEGRGGDRVPAACRVMLAPRSKPARGMSSSCSTISRTANSSLERSAFYQGRNSVMPGSPRPEKRAASLTSPSSRSPTSASSRTPSRRRIRSGRTSARRATRSSDLLDERHDRDAELHPADCGRPRELGDGSARSYAAAGITAGQRIVSTYNAGPFVAGAALAAFDLIGLCHIPVGTGNTERLLLAIERLRPEAAVLTPSYAAHLVEVAAERDVDLRSSSVERVLVAGEPGGGEPALRAKLEDAGARGSRRRWASATSASRSGASARSRTACTSVREGIRHPELIDPDTGGARALVDGASGELVLTHLRHRAAPLLRFRTRDHVEVRMAPCACGRTGPRVRCVGRTDDMLIVRGVNVFPTAIRDVVGAFSPRVVSTSSSGRAAE